MKADSQRIASLQILRFVAAAAVVVFHACIRIKNQNLSFIGAAGVDVFFVLSGFVICMTGPLANPRPSAGLFFWRRWSRVAPIYYLISAAIMLMVIYLGRFSLPITISTFLFWPAAGPEIVKPYIIPAWTLCYEMIFYSAVSVMLIGGRIRRNLASLAGVLVALVIARAFSDWNPLRVLTNPLFLEFGMGAAMALAWPRLRQLPVAVGVGMIAIALVGYALDIELHAKNPFYGVGGNIDWDAARRVVQYGTPALLLVCGAAICDRALRGRIVSILGWLGDASYSIYLIQQLSIPSIRIATLSAIGPQHPAIASALAIGGTVAIGALTYAVIEKPILRDLRRWRPTRLPWRSAPVAETPT